MARLTLSDVRKSYGKVDVIHGVDLDVDDGEFVVFVGPSGCGKSTLLRMVAGLEEITGGTIAIDGRRVNELPPAERGIAMVFQSYALYPHKDVYGNMAFALRHAGVDKKTIDERVRLAAGILGLEPLLERKPKQLSGGQRQRVAIGRAIVRDPKIFLFDEPLSNLDAALRVQMRVEILKLHQRLSNTMVYVTHDQVEAMTLADRIVVLQAGVIEQVGTPMDLYERPANQFVAGFIGSPKMNFLAAKPAGEGRVRLGDGSEVALDAGIGAAGGPMTYGIRPEHLSLADPAEAPMTAKVQVVERLGGETLLHLQLADGGEVVVKTDGTTRVALGETVGLRPKAGAGHLFDAKGRALPPTVGAKQAVHA
jgi:ABC-type sugar transport system ATPase subunit